MKVMVLVKASQESEAGQMPSTEELRAMGEFNDELIAAGIMLAGEGLHPTSRARRVRFDDGGRHRVTDGPFAETPNCLPATGCGRCARSTRPPSGSSAPPSRPVPSWSCARCSRWRTSVRLSPPNCAPGNSASGNSPATIERGRGMKLIPFLNFQGQAHDAMAFYAHALGGQVVSETRYRDLPPMDG